MPDAGVDEMRFDMRYDGPEVESGRMNVRQLAPALLAVADLVHESSDVLYPGAPAPRVDIHATDRGSFLVDLALSSSSAEMTQHAIAVYQTIKDKADALAVILGLTFGGIQTALIIEGRVIQQRTDQPDGQVTLHLADGTTLTIPPERADLLTRPNFWAGARSIAQPLGEGVTSLEIRREDDLVRVTAEQKPSLERPILDPVVTESEARVILTVLQPTFAEGYKWKFSDGSTDFFASIEDHEFITSVMLGDERFGAGDRLDCNLVTRQTITTDDKLKTERAIIQVLSHTPGPHQQALPFDESDQ